MRLLSGGRRGLVGVVGYRPNVNINKIGLRLAVVVLLLLLALAPLQSTGACSASSSYRMLAAVRTRWLAPRPSRSPAFLSRPPPPSSSRAASARLRSLTSMAAAVAGGSSGSKPRVIVVTGPTAVGKSSLALQLCRDLRGEIISVDSVQVYRRLDIGSNKPTPEERAAVPHHLLDVLDANAEEAFTAGDFLRQAEACIDDVLGRGRVPVVVGGTSMYTQWLVQGRPDAPRRDPEVEARAREMLAPFQARGDWQGGLAVLAQRHPPRAAALSPNDWYRLERALTVSLMAGGAGGDGGDDDVAAEIFTGERRSKLGDKYDFRCFFLIAPRKALCHVIDQRCLQMVERGLLEETVELLAARVLDPESPPGRAIGYRQAIEYLRRADVADEAAEEGALKAFLEGFATATRRYAKQQMVWYRAQPEFVWVRWDLQDQAPAQATVRACYEEAGAAHAGRRAGPEQAALREENLQEGKKMKCYVSSVLAGVQGEQLRALVGRAWACRQRLQAAASGGGVGSGRA